ncbi:putative APC1-subunit of anaphase-promoting complex [Serendipita vermifera]|nr:putative APC1-subunit of anaphase-promoting complex [Serendipita vermifera]
MSFITKDAYFARLSSLIANGTESTLLQTIRKALQHHEDPSEIIGQTCNYSDTTEELLWSRNRVVWLSGGRVHRHWDFSQDHEEIRAVSWAHFEEMGVGQEGNCLDKTPLPSLQALLDRSSLPAFGPYETAMRNHFEVPSTPSIPDLTTKPETYDGPPSDALVRALCIIFRTFAQIFCENGEQYVLSVPFLTRQAWPLYPVGIAIEQEVLPDASAWITSSEDIDPVLCSLSSPLRPLAPIGLTHLIRYSTSGRSFIYQDDQPIPNKNANDFTGIKRGEKTIFIQHHPSPCHGILFTVDTRLQLIRCYVYGYSPTNRIPNNKVDNPGLSKFKSTFPNDDALSVEGEGADTSRLLASDKGLPASKDRVALERSASARWIIEETPPPAGWRDPGPQVTEEDQEDADVFTPFNDEPPMELDEEDEEAVIPEYWLQELVAIPIDIETADNWKSIVIVEYNNNKLSSLASSFAVFTPNTNCYRIVDVKWDLQVPFIPQSSLVATINPETQSAMDMIPIKALRPDHDDLLVLRPNGNLALISENQCYDVCVCLSRIGESPQLRLGWAPEDKMEEGNDDDLRIRGITRQSKSEIIVTLVGGKQYPLSVNLQARNSLTADILATLQFALPSPDFNSLRRRHIQLWITDELPSSLQGELDCLWTALLEVTGCDPSSVFLHTTTSHKQTYDELTESRSHSRFSDDAVLSTFLLPKSSIEPSQELPITSSLVPPVLFVLHILGQSLRVNKDRSDLLQFLVPILIRLSRYTSPEWADYWYRLCPDAKDSWSAVAIASETPKSLPLKPPDFLRHCLRGTSWTDLHSIPLSMNVLINNHHDQLNPHVCSNLADLSHFFDVILHNRKMADLNLGETLACHMVTRNWSLRNLDSLPISLAIPLREMLRVAQISSKMSYTPETYELIDRPDLRDLVRGAVAEGEIPAEDNEKAAVSVGQIVSAVTRTASGFSESTNSSEVFKKDMFAEIRWHDDRRLEEVQIMLQSSRTPVIKIQYSLPPSEHEKEHAAVILRISERTLSLPSGRALFTYGSLSEANPEAYIIPKIELSARIMPLNTVVVLESSKLTTETKNWTDFHNGVAAGLRLAPHSKSVESSWIQFAKPSELTADHAGFLFGLGLNGHLKQVDTWNTFSYLSPKHELTSMAILLGLAASNIGSSNHYITRLIAVHTPALLPIRTVDINVSLLTQSAGLVALGLLFLGTGDRRLADIAFREIAREDIMVPSHISDNREAYTVAAALAFGMIMVGRGSKSGSVADNIWLARFRLLIHGDRKVATGQDLPKNFDLNITAPGACLALALLYLKSGRVDIADIVSVPTTRIALNTVPPNLLLLRTLAKSLILWDDIQPSVDWVNAQYLPMKTQSSSRAPIDAPTVNALDIASYNVIAGACMAISLKYAGTASADAFKVVVFYYDVLIRGAYSNARTYEHSIRRQATRDAINVLSCAMAIIMAGSGDIECLQRLRFAHGQYAFPNKFGMHMANHMAMGLLFLGGGRYTLGSSDAAICALLTAFYPRFPLIGYDNRFHLQALRHLWVIAVEPRCLFTRDVDTRKIVLLPVKLKVTETHGRIGSLPLLAPTLIPGFESVRSLRVDSPRYWPIFIDYEHNSSFKNSLIRSQTVWVKRRRGFLGYYDDPHCTKSSFVRSSGGATGDVACLISPELLESNDHNSRDFVDFMTSFSEDGPTTAFAELLCSNDANFGSELGLHSRIRKERAWNTYCQASVIDCFSGDKPRLLSAYLALHEIKTRRPEQTSRGDQIVDILEMQDWQRRTTSQRFALLRSQVVRSVALTNDEKLEGLRKDRQFMKHLQNYVNGRQIRDDVGGSKESTGRQLAFYLIQTRTPSAYALGILKRLYIETVQAGVRKGVSPDSLRSALMMVMKETALKAFDMEWQWHAISDVLSCWREG